MPRFLYPSYTIFKYHMSIYNEHTGCIVFICNFADNLMNGSACHLRYIHLICCNSDIAQPRIKKIIKSHDGNIFRNPVAFIFKFPDQIRSCKMPSAYLSEIYNIFPDPSARFWYPGHPLHNLPAHPCRVPSLISDNQGNGL